MKKIKSYALLLAGLILTSLAGCGNAKQTTEKESSLPIQVIQTADVTSDTEPCDDITVEESASPAVEPETPVTSETAPIQTAEEKMPEAPPKENPIAPPSVQSEQPRQTETPAPKQAEVPQPEEQKPSPQPVQPQTPAPAEPKPPAPQPSEEPKEPEFDIEYWISFAKSYAVSIGLELSPDAVECWDNPIIAGAHSKYLKRDITDCLSCYKNIEGFTGVWIWAEPDGKGAYKLYIGYE